MSQKFKHLKLFSLLGVSLLTAIGVISGVSLSNKSADRVDAGTTATQNFNLWVVSKEPKDYNGIHIWNIDFGTNSPYNINDLVYWFTNFKGKVDNNQTITNNTTIWANADGSYNIMQQNALTDQTHYDNYGNHYIYNFPSYVCSFEYQAIRTNGTDCWNHGAAYSSGTTKQRIGCGQWKYDAAGSWELEKSSYSYNFTTYTVTKKYSLAGVTGTQIGTETYYQHYYYKKPSNPSNPTGYTFSKWTTDLAGSNEIGTTKTFSGDTTIYAYCAANTTGIMFMSEGGEGGDTSVTATYGLDMPSITPPTKDGYQFDGYFDKSSGGKQYYTSSGTSANKWDKDLQSTILYAQWTEVTKPTHNVTYLAGGASGSVPTQAPVEEESTFTVASASTLSKEHYSFTGWHDGSSVYQPGATYTMGTSDVILIAQWTEDTKYTVTFRNDIDTETLATCSVYSGETATYTGPTPTKPQSGDKVYTFDKWVTTAGGSTEATLTNITENKTVYAHFSENYVDGIYFDNFTRGTFTRLVDDGTGTQVTCTVTITQGDEFKIISYKNGAIEWYNDNLDGNRYDSALYAKQLEHKVMGNNIKCNQTATYHVYFKDGTIYIPAIGTRLNVTLSNGEGASPVSSTIKGLTGMSLKVDQVPTKPNHTFMGYYDSTYTIQFIKADGYGEYDIHETHDFTIYAKWVKSSITSGQSVYLDCKNVLDSGSGFRWDDGDAHFKAYLWRDGLEAIVLEGRNLVHGINDNEHVYEFTIPESQTEYFTYVKFERWNSDYTKPWDETGTLGFVYGTNAFSLDANKQHPAESTYSWSITTEMRDEYYSKYFMSTCTCDGSSYTFDPARWDDVETEFNNMCKGAKDGFKNATPSTGAEYTLENAVGRYDELVSKRGFENFAGRSVTPSSSKFISLADMFNNSSITLIVVIVSLVGVSVVGGYFFYRRRKEN